MALIVLLTMLITVQSAPMGTVPGLYLGILKIEYR